MAAMGWHNSCVTEAESCPKAAKRLAEIHGRAGATLSEHWQPGMRTFHSFMTDDFPNLFFLSPNQGGQSFNFTQTLDEIAPAS